jgi:hypothetical protein
MTEIQMTEMRNEEVYPFVAPGFHAGRFGLRRPPGMEAGRYDIKTSDSSCFGHSNLKPWNLFRISSFGFRIWLRPHRHGLWARPTSVPYISRLLKSLLHLH